MDVLIGLVSIVGVSLFASEKMQRSSALGPLVAVSVAMLWMSAFGCVGLLWLGGWLWYGAALAAWAWLLFVKKKKLAQMLTPGIVFFAAASVFFIVLFWATSPLFTQWDEFTFWGTAAKVLVEKNQLYTVVQSNLIARSYPPGLPAFGYLMQFFGGVLGAFSEYKLMAAYAIIYMAAFSAASALWGKNKAGATTMLLGMVLLPIFFETNVPIGQMFYAYLSVMADIPLAVLFGGALCLYYAGGEKSARLWLPFCVVLAALVNIKDIGLALAMIALFVALLDMAFCERDRLHFWKFHRWKAWAFSAVSGLLFVVGSYLVWAVHLTVSPQQINRFDVGSKGESLSQFEMLGAGIKALLGIQPDEKFSDITKLMLEAFFKKPIFLLGSSAVMLGIIFLVLGVTWMLSGTKRQRIRITAYFGVMLFCFAAFYLFNIFTYTYILKDVESYVLKDYHRYMLPFWFGWLMGAMVLLSRATQDEKSLRFRLRAARGASAGLALVLLMVVVLRGNSAANFLRVSPSLYTHRWDVQQVVTQAESEGMKPEDVVYTISQGDDSTRFYMFSYELPAKMSLLFEGEKTDEKGNLVLDENGNPILVGNTSASFVAPGRLEASAYVYKAEITPKSWAKFLKQQGCTHVMLDVIDEYIVKDFGPLFSDGLQGWELDGELQTGRRYYKIVWQGDSVSLVPANGGAAA